MLDGQFSAQNGTPAPAPGISVIVAPSGAAPVTATPEQNKWIVAETPPNDGKKIQIADNMSTMDRVILCASEFCGTAMLLFLGCGSCVDFSGGARPPTHLQICITFGLAVMVAIQSFGHVSGGHINPIVTVAAAVLGNIPLIQVPIFFVGQFLGALAGFGLLKVVTPAELIKANASAIGVCSPGIAPGISVFQGLLVEFLTSFILVLVCCGVWDIRNSTRHDSTPIRFGFAIAVLALAGGPYTGANMNPVRSIAPALINGDWQDHWVYWVGPLLAGLTGALFYRLLFAKDTVEETPRRASEVIALQDKA